MNYLRLLAIGAVTGLILTGSVAAQDREFDIVGMKLGASPEEIKKIASPEMENTCVGGVKFGNININHMVGHSWSCENGPITLVSAGFHDDKAIFFLKTVITIGSETPPKKSDMNASLTAKYGEPDGVLQSSGEHAKFQQVIYWLGRGVTKSSFENAEAFEKECIQQPEQTIVNTECGITLIAYFSSNNSETVDVAHTVVLVDNVAIGKGNMMKE